jgi:type II secretory pathway component GspD/PulD (secretin)/tetratricopeptide (TPR) repeat protein
MAKGNYDAAQALVGEAEHLNATYMEGEDTPIRVYEDLAKQRALGTAGHPTDAKGLLVAARAALARGDLDTAEQLAREAEKAGSFWTSMTRMWSDSPAKVLKDVQTARAKQPRQNSGKSDGYAPQTGMSVPPLQQSAPRTQSMPAGDNAVRARELLKGAHRALEAGNVAEARKLTNEAKTLKVELNWWEDTPEKLLAEIHQREIASPQTAAKPSAVADASADPHVLLKRARDLYNAGKLEEADKLAQQASTARLVRWGLFEDSPDKLLGEIHKARFKHDQEESVKVLAEARKLYTQGNLKEAEHLAHRAERLHGPYTVWDLGDRPQRLLADIETAKNKDRKNPVPPPSGELVHRDANKPSAPDSKTAQSVGASALGAVAPGMAGSTPPPVWPANDTAPRPSPYTPRVASTSTDGGKLRAQMLLTEARQLQKEGRLLEARQKALEAQKAFANFGPEEDRPELVLLAVSALCQKRIETLMQQAGDYAATSEVDPSRYQRAVQELAQARQLAVGFGFDTQLIDSKLATLAQSRGVHGAPQSNAGLTQITQAQHQEGMTGSENPEQHGRTLLNQARLELRAGQTANARRLAEAAFDQQYGVQTEAAQVLRSIDAEEFNQKTLNASRSFEAGLAAFHRQEYAQAGTIMRTLDARVLAPDKQARLKEIMLLPEMQPTAVVQASARGTSTPLADAAGKAQATDLASPQTRPEPDFAQQVKAMHEVQFQKLRTDGLQVQSEAMKRFQAGDTDAALEMLQEYNAGLAKVDLDSEHIALLRRPVEARLQQLKTLKHQRDFEKAQTNEKEAKTQGLTRAILAEEEKKKQLNELMKQYHTFYKDGKYAEAEMYAMRAHELDPDDSISAVAAEMARRQLDVTNYKRIKDGKQRMFEDGLNDSEDEGPAVTSHDPLHLDPRVSMQNKDRKAIDILKVGETKSEKEREIYRRLDGPITSLDFKDTPLRQVLDDLQGWTGINIVPDEPALNENGISLDRPVTMKLEGVALKSALNLLLHQVHLTYVVKDEVINVTTEEHARGKLTTRIHPVLDLVMPVENAPTGGSNFLKTALQQSMGEMSNVKLNGVSPYLGQNSLGGASPVSQNQSMASASATSPFGGVSVTKENPKGTLEDVLIKLITNTIAPQSWASVGGQGTIDFYPLGMALVINQTPDIQEQVAELLAALRRLQDQEVAVEVRFITIAESFYERIGLDFNVNIKTNNTNFEPQLVSQQFAPFGFINSFNPKNFITGLTPAGSFTQDLNIPIKASSFQMAVPPFGGFPNIPGANGGLDLGLAFLSDIQVFMFMEAAQGDQRTNVMQAPKLTLFNGQTANITVADQQFFVTNVTVVQAGGQVVFVPTNTPIPTGGVNLTINAVISADRRFVRLSLVPTLTNLASANVPLFPITTFITPIFEGGATGAPVPFTQFLQQPTFDSIDVNTTVNVPDGGTVLLGGLKKLSEGRNEFGPPILSKLPYINRLFKNVGYGREAESLMMMVTPRIIINEEEELRQVPGVAPGAAPPPP